MKSSMKAESDDVEYAKAEGEKKINDKVGSAKSKLDIQKNALMDKVNAEKDAGVSGLKSKASKGLAQVDSEAETDEACKNPLPKNAKKIMKGLEEQGDKALAAAGMEKSYSCTTEE